MSHPLFGPEIRFMLAENDQVGLRSLCEELHPVTLADALDDFTSEQVWEIISQAEIRQQAAIFEYLPPARQVQMIETARPQVGQLIGKMSHDDRVDLLRRVPAKVKESLLRVVDEADRKDIATLVAYDDDTVGSLMTTDYAWLPPHLSAAEAIDQLRIQAPDRETIYYIYVLDELRRKPDGSVAPRRLLGVVSLRDLILAPRQAIIRDLMADEIVTLDFRAPAEKAGQVLARYDFVAMPVVDSDYGMLGIITHDDVIDIITEEATEDLQRQAGINPLQQSYLDSSFYAVWRSRAFWLSLLFVAELGTFTVMTIFEETIATVVVLSLFVPLCISTGGNSGSQAATLITRAIALGEVTTRDWKRVMRRELMMGLALGTTLGGIAFFRGAATPSDTRESPHTEKVSFAVRVPAERPLTQDSVGDYELGQGVVFEQTIKKPQRIRLPEGATIPNVVSTPAGLEYQFPANCEVRTQAVSRWKLGQVVGLSVLGICMWGTLIGATLPIVFKHFNRDPAVASGPFVATFVDITGIAIFFLFARWFLLQ